MKISFKKSTAMAISALSILVSAPSAFCSPRAVPSEVHCTRESYDINFKPMNNIRNLPQSLKTAQKLLETSTLNTCDEVDDDIYHSDRSLFSTEVLTNDEVTTKSLDHLVKKSHLEAPFATVVGDYGFTNQINVKKIVLPKVSYLGSYAFEYCDNLEEVVFTNKLTHIEPGAFARCNKNLKIVYEGKVYSITGLLSKIRPTVKVSISAPTYHGNGNINPIYYRNSNTSKYNPW